MNPTNLEPRHQEIGEFCVALERRAPDFHDPKLWKGRSGTRFFFTSIQESILNCEKVGFFLTNIQEIILQF